MDYTMTRLKNTLKATLAIALLTLGLGSADAQHMVDSGVNIGLSSTQHRVK